MYVVNTARILLAKEEHGNTSRGLWEQGYGMRIPSTRARLNLVECIKPYIGVFDIWISLKDSTSLKTHLP